MCLRPFGLCCSACLGILFVSILYMCCSRFSWYCFISFTIFSAPVFPLIFWFFSLFSLNLIFTFRNFADAPKKIINRALYLFVAWDIGEYTKSMRGRRLRFGCLSLPQHLDIRTGSWNHLALYLLGTNADSLGLKWSEIVSITEILKWELAVKKDIVNRLKMHN